MWNSLTFAYGTIYSKFWWFHVALILWRSLVFIFIRCTVVFFFIMYLCDLIRFGLVLLV